MDAATVISLDAIRATPTVGEADGARWKEASLRERMLCGAWRLDLEEALGMTLDRARRKAWPRACTALCGFRSITGQIAIQADQEPEITCEGATDEQLEQMRAWRPLRLHAHLARMVVGIREYAMALTWDDDRDEPAIGLQDTHILLAADPIQPSIPVRWEEPVARQRPGHSAEWLWKVWDITDPAAPRWALEVDRGHGRVDVTADYADEDEREWATTYPWRYSDGMPYIPRVLYHAREPAGLWDWMDGSEAVQATLDIGVAWTEWLHILHDASWAQKYGLDVQLAGKLPQPGGEASTIPVDQSSILMLRSREGQGSVGVLGVAADPESFARAVRSFMEVCAESYGLSATDIEATSAGQSGVSIALRRDAVRRLQRPIATSMARGDEEWLRKIAALANAHGYSLPEEGWHVDYPAVEPTREELQAQRTAMTAELDAGLTSRVELVMARDRVDRAEAIRRLLQYAADEAQISSTRAKLLTPPALRQAPPPKAEDEMPMDEEQEEMGDEMDDETETPDPVE